MIISFVMYKELYKGRRQISIKKKLLGIFLSYFRCILRQYIEISHSAFYFLLNHS